MVTRYNVKFLWIAIFVVYCKFRIRKYFLPVGFIDHFFLTEREIIPPLLVRSQTSVNNSGADWSVQFFPRDLFLAKKSSHFGKRSVSEIKNERKLF